MSDLHGGDDCVLRRRANWVVNPGLMSDPQPPVGMDPAPSCREMWARPSARLAVDASGTLGYSL